MALLGEKLAELDAVIIAEPIPMKRELKRP